MGRTARHSLTLAVITVALLALSVPVMLPDRGSGPTSGTPPTSEATVVTVDSTSGNSTSVVSSSLPAARADPGKPTSAGSDGDLNAATNTTAPPPAEGDADLPLLAAPSHVGGDALLAAVMAYYESGAAFGPTDDPWTPTHGTITRLPHGDRWVAVVESPDGTLQVHHLHLDRSEAGGWSAAVAP